MSISNEYTQRDEKKGRGRKSHKNSSFPKAGNIYPRKCHTMKADNDKNSKHLQIKTVKKQEK